MKHSLGASVVEGHLCLLCLRLGVGRPEVVAALRLALPAGADEEPAFLEEVAAYLIANRIPAGVRVTLGVPRGQFVLRRFETPKVAARSLPELVGFEMDRHLPGRREDFLCGWRVEGRTAEGGYAVLLGAGRKAALERPLALLRRANLAPASIQPESFVLAECLRRATHEAGDVLLIDLAPSAAGIDLVRDGRVAFSRTVGIDDPQWREASGADAAAERREAAQRLGASLAELLASPLFRESLPGGTLPPLRIGGYGANRSHLVEKLESETRVPVRAFSPWTLVGWASPPADLSPYGAALALALVDGAEGAGLELDPARQEQLHRAPSLRASAVLALLLVGVAVTYLGVFAMRQRAQSALVDREIRVLKTKMVEVEAINRRLQQERAQLEFLRSTISGSARQAEILRELTVLLPDGCYLSEMTYRERKVEIAGFAPSASQLLPAIEASPMFAEVEFSAPIVAQNTGLERFRIRMRLEQPGG